MIERGLESLVSRECPDCNGFIFRPGPRGGMSRNIECVGCGVRFNVAYVGDHLAIAERIDRMWEWREDLFPRVLQ